MKVEAKHHLKYNGNWYKPGQEFEISLTEADQMSKMVSVVEPLDRDEPAETEKPKKGNRKP